LTIKVALADDEELFRAGIALILSRDPEIEIVHQSENGQQLLDYLATQERLPDIVVTDIKMPELNGVEVTKILRKLYPEISVVALTTYNTKPFIRNMINVGASAYLVKNSAPSHMLNTVKQVFHNGFYYDNLVMEVLNKKYHSPAADKSVFDADFLTVRESEILRLICKQYITSEIAKALFISPRTVEVHRKHLLLKTEVKNIAGLVVFALQNGLVPPFEIE
jgi:DNA-binding NarL/FixJ family response regulator